MSQIRLLFHCTERKPGIGYEQSGPCHLVVGVIASYMGITTTAYAPLAEMPVELHTATFEEWCEHEWVKPLIDEAKTKIRARMTEVAASLEGIA